MAFKNTWIMSDWSLSISLTSAPFSLCSLGWRAAAVIAPGFQQLGILSLCSTNFLNWSLLSSQATPLAGDHFRLLVSVPQSVGCLTGFQTFRLAHLDFELSGLPLAMRSHGMVPRPAPKCPNHSVTYPWQCLYQTWLIQSNTRNERS